MIRDRRLRTQARDQWLTLLPYMSMGMVKAMEFNEYFDRVSGRNIDLRPSKDILAEVEEIRRYM